MGVVLCPVLLGREAELAVLRAALAAAGQGHGGLLALTGEPGVGKSRLLAELSGEASSGGMTVATGRAVPAGTVTPYRPLAEALLQAVRDRDWPAAAGQEPWAAALRDVLSLPGTAGAPEPQSAAGLTPVIRGEAVVRLLRQLTAAAPVLLGLEDLQWADADTLAVVEYLADNLRDAAVLCVVTVRSEPPSAGADLVAAMDGRRSARLVRLAPLTADDARQVVLACRPAAPAQEIARVVAAADGLPFLIEELLAAPGVPRSLTDSVGARLARLSAGERRVIEAAAVLGRQFDWTLLAGIAGQEPEVVTSALERAVEGQLLASAGPAYRFRHALTADAVTGGLLPHVRARLAAAALAAVDAAHPGLPGSWRQVAADLAAQAGDTDRAARLLRESGQESLRRGGLATAIDALRRAAGLAREPGLRHDAQLRLVEALALAGRADECEAAGEALLGDLGVAAGPAATRAHLAIAQAAAQASRWPLADRQLRAAGELLAARPDPVLIQRCRLLAAEQALAARQVERARELAELVLTASSSASQVRCHAFELLGRSLRATGLEAALAAFEAGLACAEAADLPLWRLRALHELGTIELFDRAGAGRLRQARRTAGELGAAGTAVVLDIQLAAVGIFRFDADLAIEHAEGALAGARRLHLSQLEATALVFMAEAYGLRRDEAAMERHNVLALAAAPDDAEIAASASGGRGVAALLSGDLAGARRGLQRAAELLDPLPNSGPAIYRGLWPLLLATGADDRAATALHAARQAGITVNRANRGLLLLAEAVLAGRADRAGGHAGELAERAAAELTHVPAWGHIGWLLTAEAALADGWGQPRSWLAAASRALGDLGIQPLAERCEELLARPADPLAAAGITAREREILGLVARGLSNKDIAARLVVSHRTVEKHVESLLRKSGARSRTQLSAAVTGLERR